VSQRTAQLVSFYQECRIVDQVRFYAGRRTLFDRAAAQALSLSAILLGFTAAAAALAGAHTGPVWAWSLVATILPAASTALTSYSSLYAFEQQSKIYGDAVRAVYAAARPVAKASPAAPRSAEEDAADLVKRVEAVFRQEQAQWGQLTSQIEIHDDTKA
jgi:SMODS and SLOG-associating 2TM effector domain 1